MRARRSMRSQSFDRKSARQKPPANENNQNERNHTPYTADLEDARLDIREIQRIPGRIEPHFATVGDQHHRSAAHSVQMSVFLRLRFPDRIRKLGSILDMPVISITSLDLPAALASTQP